MRTVWNDKMDCKVILKAGIVTPSANNGIANEPSLAMLILKSASLCKAFP
jgi:hypothetical protein